MGEGGRGGCQWAAKREPTLPPGKVRAELGRCNVLPKIMVFNLVHCNENPIYVVLEKELGDLCPNLNIHVSVNDLRVYISRIGPHIFLQQSRQNDRGNI
jgi:hypothetical protein